MKKLVNGKVIDINNIELFELAAEGLVLQNMAVSNTADGVNGEINSLQVHKYIRQYDLFFKSMPYPLYAIEADIKYATLGNFLKSISKDTIYMWIDNGLHIKIDEGTGMTLKIVNNTWSIIYDKSVRKDNTSMELYKNCTGYREYLWVLKKIVNKEGTANFYNEFMPEFVRACNEEPMVLKWELENILTFCSIPNRVELKENKVINLTTNEEYSLDIFCTGNVDTGEEMPSWSLGYDNSMSISSRRKQLRTYGFEAYSKELNTSKINNKISKCKVNGLHNLFLELCGIKNATDSLSFPVFKGVIVDSTLVFTIGDKLFTAKSNRLQQPTEIAYGVEIYAVENGKVYFTKAKKVSDVATKEILYSFSLKDEKLRLCKIMFRY